MAVYGLLALCYNPPMRPVIILPTYNEKKNLEEIVRAIFEVGIPGLRIIIVDDNSPDGTGRIADHLAATYPPVEVIHRPRKEGLGKAYVAGFKQALADPQTGYVFEMDADFSHQPKYLPVFLEKIKEADIVLGSRYVSGGGVANWGLARRFISQLANTVIRLVLGVPIRDLTGGFKCFRRRVLEELQFESMESSGYNFQIEVNYRAFRRGYRIMEIPIVFIERRAGQSKFSFAIMLESFRKVLKLRFR